MILNLRNAEGDSYSSEENELFNHFMGVEVMLNDVSVPPWHPLKRPLFTFLVIDQSGIPLFSYPQEHSSEVSESNETILVSGLLMAINNFAREISGDDIRDLTFGSYAVTVSRGCDNTLCVLLCDSEYISNLEEAKSLHVEITSMLYSAFPNLGKFVYDLTTNRARIESIFKPFYKLKVKQYLKRQHEKRK